MKIYKTHKNIEAGLFTAGTLAELQAMPAQYPGKRRLRKTLCAPEKHRWQNKKFSRRCIYCGKEELKP